MKWKKPKMWKGARAFVLGGGPSINKLDLEKLRQCREHDVNQYRTIAVNTAGKVAPWADILYFSDKAFSEWEWNQELIEDFPGLVVTTEHKYENHPRVKYLGHAKRGTQKWLLNNNPGLLARGTNSGFAACMLARELGARPIILLGFDMRPVWVKNPEHKNGEEKLHNFHKEHGRKVADNRYETQFMRPFADVAEALKEEGTEIINATPGSAMDIFPIANPEEYMI